MEECRRWLLCRLICKWKKKFYSWKFNSLSWLFDARKIMKSSNGRDCNFLRAFQSKPSTRLFNEFLRSIFSLAASVVFYKKIEKLLHNVKLTFYIGTAIHSYTPPSLKLRADFKLHYKLFDEWPFQVNGTKCYCAATKMQLHVFVSVYLSYIGKFTLKLTWYKKKRALPSPFLPNAILCQKDPVMPFVRKTFQ